MRIFLIALLLCCFSGDLFAEAISIAVPDLHVKRSVLQGFSGTQEPSPYLEVLRSGVVPPAIGATSTSDSSSFQGESALLFIKSIEWTPREPSDEWECQVDLDPSVTFQNGEGVTARDMVSSFRRCGDSHVASTASERGSGRGEEEQSSIRIEQREERQVTVNGRRREIQRILATCPILQERSAKSFGERLGTVNFMVGVGAYEIKSIKPGIRVTLSKVKESWLNRERYPKLGAFPPSIEVQAISDARRALTALRYGSIDLMFLDGGMMKDLGAGDETIESGECRGFPVLYRKGLRVECEDPRWVALLRYES